MTENNGEHYRVLRFEIPIDDQPHEIPHGKVLMMTPERRFGFDRVEIWVHTEVEDRFPAGGYAGGKRPVQVFGTGQQLPAGAEPLVSCLHGPLVWHLCEVAS